MKTILLADDDSYVIDGMLKHLPWEEMGVRIVGSASNGAEALEKFQELKPDIVITDVYMPEMDGFELTKAIHDIDASVPIVFLSGYDDFTNARKAANSGIQHFLLKPPSVSEIAFVVREVVEALNENKERDELLASYVRQQDVLRRSMRDVFFRDLLSTRYRSEELPEQRIAFMGLPRSVRVQALSLNLIRPEFMNKQQERDWQLLRFGTGNILRETVSKRIDAAAGYAAEAIEHTDKEFVVLFLSPEGTAPLTEEFVHDVSTEIIDNILKYMKISVLGGLGREVAGYHRIIDSYLESQVAVGIAEMNEINKVYRYEERETQPGSGSVSSESVATINEAILKRQTAEALELWRRIKTEMSEEAVPFPVVRGVVAGLASALWTSAASVPEAAHTFGTLEELMLALGGCSSAAQAMEWMDQQFIRWRTVLGDPSSGKKSHALVERVIKDYIEKGYHQSITLEEIAAELHVHRNYLSQLFKKITGEPFVTYLNKYRIEKAKELLRTGKYMVYEISGMVGFQNATYFSQVFKSIAGCSPTEFYQ